jgi:predicted small metal-binding protein
MARLINCQCGRAIRGETDQEVIRQAQEHIRENHPELVDTITSEQLADWIEED